MEATMGYVAVAMFMGIMCFVVLGGLINLLLWLLEKSDPLREDDE